MNVKISMKTSYCFAAALLSVGVFQSIGAVVFSNPITGTNPNTSNPYTTGQTVDSNVTVSGIGRGPGISGNNANDRYNANSWNTVSLDTDAYFTFTITPASGFSVSFSDFVYTGQASGSGATSVAFRSSIDSFAGDIGTPTTGGTTIDLSDSAYQNLTTATEFRLYGWGASASGGTFSVNSFTFNGTVSAVPEPSEYAGLAGAGLIGFALWRRRAARKA
jgi:hypothetical protein